MDVDGGTAPYQYVFTIQHYDTSYEHISSGPTYSYDCDFIGDVTVGGYVLDSSGPTISTYTVEEQTFFVKSDYERYQRPNDWLTFSTINPGEEVVYGIFAVFTQSHNYTAFICEGDYTVDWGDGTVIDYASGVKAEYDFSWSAYTATSSVGYKQAMVKITPQAGNNLSRIDFAELHTNQTTTNAHSGWVCVEMQAATCSSFGMWQSGNSLRHENLEEFVWYGTNLVTNWDNVFRYCYNLRSVNINFDSCTQALRTFSYCWRLIDINGGNISFPNATTTRYTFEYCHKLTWIESLFLDKTTDTEGMFQRSYSLVGFESISLPAAQNVDLMFQLCYSLVWVPLFDTSTVTNMGSMFNYCYSLRRVPEFDTSGVITMNDFVANCTSLQRFPLLDTSSATNMYRFFDGCNSLVEVPELSFSQATQARVMFRNCRSLKRLPKLEFPLVTDADLMFNNCFSLEEVDITFTQLQDAGEMFQGCYSLRSINDNWTDNSSTDFANQYYNCLSLTRVPYNDTSNSISFQTMFYNCYAKEFPDIDCSSTTSLYRMFYQANGVTIVDFITNTGSVTNFRGMFRQCPTVTHIKNIDWSSCTNTTFLFYQAYNLRRIEGCNIPITFTIADCDFEAAELDEIFTDLPVVVGKTITVSGNPGAATCDPTIATAKGWSVST